MELSVWIERENNRLQLDFSGTTVRELLEQLKINPETVLVVRENQVITESEILQHKNHLEILSVISGG